MKTKLLPVVRAIVLVSAALTVLLRFLAYKYDTVLPETLRRQMNAVSVAAAAVLLASGLVWILLERTSKKGNTE